MNATPLEYLSRVYPGHKPEVLRGHLSSFGLSADLATQRISTLSGESEGKIWEIEGGDFLVRTHADECGCAVINTHALTPRH